MGLTSQVSSITIPWCQGPELILQECPILGKPHASPNSHLPFRGNWKVILKSELCMGVGTSSKAEEVGTHRCSENVAASIGLMGKPESNRRVLGFRLPGSALSCKTNSAASAGHCPRSQRSASRRSWPRRPRRCHEGGAKHVCP